MNQGIEKSVLIMVIAQAGFVISGYILHAGLGRLWGPEKYGFFVIVLSILIWVELVTTSGIPTTIGKFIAEEEDKVKGLLSQGMKIQMILSITIVAIVFFSAPLISSLLGDEKLTFYLRLASIDVPFMSILALHWKTLGGLRAFTRKAITIIVYCTFKVLIIFTLVFLGLSLTGAFIGNCLASIVAFCVTLRFLSSLKKKPILRSETQRIIKFAIPLTIYYFSYNFLIILDLFLVKSIFKDQVSTGYYASAQSVAKIPYFIFFAFTLTLLPLLANSISKGERELSSSYINKSLRFLLILLVPLVLIINETSEELITIIYSKQYLQAAPTLSILVFGFGFLSFFLTLNTILIANNESKKVLLVTLMLIPFDVFLNFKLISIYGIEGAAIATTVTIMIGCIITSILVYKKFSTFLEMKSCLRIFTSAIFVFFISKTIPLSGVFVIIKLLILFSLYFLILYIIREIKEDEVDRIRSYVRGFRFNNI